MARGSTNLCKLVQRNLKQNIKPSNESGAKSKTDHEKAAAWLQRIMQSGTKKIDSIHGDTNIDLNELVSTSLDSHTANKLFKRTTKMNHLKITQTMIVTRIFTMIPKMIMNLIMQIKKIR